MKKRSICNIKICFKKKPNAFSYDLCLIGGDKKKNLNQRRCKKIGKKISVLYIYI